MNEDEDVSIKLREVTLDPPGDEPTHYVNICQVQFTPEEAVFRFGRRDLEVGERAHNVVTIYMSHAHAKRLMLATFTTLQGHEEMFGEVIADVTKRLTPEARERLALKSEDNHEHEQKHDSESSTNDTEEKPN